MGQLCNKTNIFWHQPISIAPMVRCSTRPMRYLWRQLSPDCLLYTEMRTASSVLCGNKEELLAYEASQKPLALQLADHSPKRLSLAVRIGEDYGYDEININIGCPSWAAQQGNFGVCLLKQPKVVENCIAAMQDVTSLPITVKTRLGVDDQDSFVQLYEFAARMERAKVASLIIHARSAWLKGLNPRQNRTRPPLRHEWVYRLKEFFPKLPIVVNGGISSLEEIEYALTRTDGVMLGREAYQNPMFIQQIGAKIYNRKTSISRYELLERMLDYAHSRYRDKREPFRHTGRHLLHLYKGIKGATRYKQKMNSLLGQDRPPDFIQLKPDLPIV